MAVARNQNDKPTMAYMISRSASAPESPAVAYLARHRQLVMHADDVEETAYSPRTWRSDSFNSIAEMVADALGWAILPVHVARRGGALHQVACPSLALPQLSVRMAWRQGRPLDAAAQWVAQRFAELLRSLA